MIVRRDLVRATDTTARVGWQEVERAADGSYQRRFDAGPPGQLTVEQAIEMLVTGDVLVHTWDLPRATGLDERLDETDLGFFAFQGYTRRW